VIDSHKVYIFVLALVLGFIAYGLSIFLYVKAQRDLGAAKTSAYYAIAPFVGSLLSFAILRDLSQKIICLHSSSC
jgi:drug/metabolite transporter (DMT)-like permease